MVFFQVWIENYRTAINFALKLSINLLHLAVAKMKKLSCFSILFFLTFLIANAQSNKELKSVFESNNVALFPRPFYYEGGSVAKLLSSEEQMLQQAQSKNINMIF